MNILFFDTETSGLWDFKYDRRHGNQPRICQLGAILCEDRKEVSAIDLIVQPDILIPAEAVAVHGISNDIVKQFGVSEKTATKLFAELVNNADLLVAHNLDFDMNVVEAAALRAHGIEFDAIETYCTMKSSTNILKLPGKYGKWKWPTLDEAYKSLVNPVGFEGAHSAIVDVRACIEVYWALMERADEERTKDGQETQT